MTRHDRRRAGRRPAFDVAARPRRTSRSCASRSTASRWSISTTPPTTQKPQAVIDALRALLRAGQRQRPPRRPPAQRAGDRRVRGRAREGAALHQRAPTPREIIFTRGTTEAINLVAQSCGRQHVGAGDEILITAMEHHSNIVPWQMLCEQTGATLRVVPINDAGELRLDELRAAARRRARSSSRSAHVSNALGTINPVERDRSTLAHARGVAGARRRRPGGAAPARSTCRSSTATSTPSPATRCSARPASACSTARPQLLEAMPPYQGGGDMIRSVTLREDDLQRRCRTSSRPARRTSPARSASARRSTTSTAIGLRRDRGARARAARVRDGAASREIPGVRIIGTARHKAAVLSFVIEGVHPHDVGTDPRPRGRRGPHRPPLRQPVMERFGVAGDRPRLVRALQHARGDRRAGRAALAQGAGGVRLMSRPAAISTRK